MGRPSPWLDAGLPPVFASDAVRLVARVFGVERDELVSQSRARHLAEARKVALWLLRMRPKPGLIDGAARFRTIDECGVLIRAPGLKPMDHSSVKYSIDKVAERAACDPAFAALLLELTHAAAPTAERRVAQELTAPPADPERAQREHAKAALRRLLAARPAPLRPSMALEQDDTDARARASGSLKLAAALGAA